LHQVQPTTILIGCGWSAEKLNAETKMKPQGCKAPGTRLGRNLKTNKEKMEQ
jgi:hypothetical protein